MELDIPSLLIGKAMGGSGGGGSSGEPESKAVDFYDVDGTRVYSYTEEEFNALTVLPTLPDHTDDGLVAQGWNWPDKDENTTSLQWMKEVLADSHALDIGAIYDTSHHGIKLVLDVYSKREATIQILLTAIDTSASGHIYVNWGDNSDIDKSTTLTVSQSKLLFSHTYSSVGKYTVDIYPENSTTTYFFGNGGNLFNCSNYSSSEAYDTSGMKCVEQIFLGSQLRALSIDYLLAHLPNLKLISFSNNSNIVSLPHLLLTSCPALRFLTIPYTITSLYGNITLTSYLKFISFPPTLEELYGCAFITEHRIIIPVLHNLYTTKGSTNVAIFKPNSPAIDDVIYVPANCLIELKNMQSFGNLNLYKLDLGETTIVSLNGYNIYNNQRLRAVILPASLTSITSTGNCSLNPVCNYYYFKSETPPTMSSSSNFTGRNIYDFAIVVPDGCSDAYKTATNWSSLASYIVEYSDYFGGNS